MEKLYISFYQQLKRVDMSFKRYLYQQISWEHRLICISGARGAGKTTLLLQHIHEQYGTNPKTVLYASLDHIWFSGHSLYDTGEQFVLNGGEVLFLDEVHKYKNWSQEIKNLYDSFPDLKIVFTGSSILEIYKGNADLSRRVVSYFLNGLSFREFLIFEKLLQIEPINLNDILEHHIEHAMAITEKIKILPQFARYLEFGFYPFYKIAKNFYTNQLIQTVNVALDTDLPAIENIDYYTIVKIKKLLYIISTLVPFTPNISQLSEQVGTSRNSLLAFIQYLDRGQIINTLEQNVEALKKLSKPEKLYLNNPNLCYAFSDGTPNVGTLRETFFCNQLKYIATVNASPQTDFLINKKFSFEIGGKNKKQKQIVGLENSFLALDHIEVGYGNHIPLWLFGFLY